ncbi:MvaI/BcnI family restriction endonuclease [Hafnia paralvei]|nr:MvaI/BcnI family restriction endonuclease [Hafnia paralvei]
MTTDELIYRLKSIMNIWHNGTRPGNDGNQGNTLEDLLGVAENNIPLPDLGGIFELKTQKKESSALVTLLHSEPNSPSCALTNLCLSLGWPHKNAGEKYQQNEMSFRSTTYGHGYSDRGFRIKADEEKLEFMFEPSMVKIEKKDMSGAYNTYGEWLNSLNNRSPHYSKVMPVTYDIPMLSKKIKTKLDNTVFVLCNTRIDPITKIKQFYYDDVFILSEFRMYNLVNLLNNGGLYLDFDARTRHNHGTKIRVKKDNLVDLFEHHIQLS